MPSVQEERWAAARIKLWMRIAGKQYEVVQYTSAFELNTIPLASVTVAVGRNVSNQQAAAIHDNFDDLVVRQKAEVFLSVESLGSGGGTPNDWGPLEGGARIFDGYVIGTGWRRGVNGAQFTIHIQHWLADLNYSSAVSGLSHPGNPADWTYPAIFKNIPMGAGGGTDPFWVPHTVLEQGLTTADLTGELWKRCLSPWMKEIAGREPIDRRLINAGVGQGNKVALDALARMNQDGDYPAKLGMELKGGEGSTIAKGVNRHLRWTVGVNAINTTLWGKLVGEWAPAYWFAVVPRVENALVVPFAGAIKGKPFCTLRTSEYDTCDLSGRMLQNLRCVGILHGVNYRAGANTNPGDMQSERNGLAGLFPSPPNNDGIVMLKDAPPWLHDPVMAYEYSRSAQGLKDNTAVQTAGTVKGTGSARSPSRDPASTQRDIIPICNQLAHAWYSVEKLKGRAGELSGRLRFDIAPGSQVKVEGGSDIFLHKDGLGRPVYGTVMRTSCLINSEAQKAGTMYTIGWLRNEKENEDEETAVEKPPLYAEKWLGGNLINGCKPPY